MFGIISNVEKDCNFGLIQVGDTYYHFRPNGNIKVRVGDTVEFILKPVNSKHLKETAMIISSINDVEII